MNRYVKLVVLSVILPISGCSNEEEPAPQPIVDTIEIAQTEIAVDAAGGEAILRFSANKDWTIRYDDDRQAVYGVLQSENGEASTSCNVTFTMHANTSAASRYARFIIDAGRAKAEVTVTQPGLGIELPSEEEVRAYLMRLYEDTDGPNWRFRGKWGSDLPLNQWGSEVKYENGRLSLILGEHYMKGKVDLSGCKALVSIRASKNNITEVDLSDCPLLEEAYFINNDITRINVDRCLSLRTLRVGYNSLNDISVGWCTTLQELGCEYNKLTRLDVGRCVELRELNCAVNDITELEIPHRKKLYYLFCYANRIKHLDVRGARFLSVLSCFNNNLEELNIDVCERLGIFWCFGNRISYEIPEWMDKIGQFEHDARYEYHEDGTYTDNGYGWWYPGEPQSMRHGR